MAWTKIGVDIGETAETLPWNRSLVQLGDHKSVGRFEQNFWQFWHKEGDVAPFTMKWLSNFCRPDILSHKKCHFILGCHTSQQKQHFTCDFWSLVVLAMCSSYCKNQFVSTRNQKCSNQLQESSRLVHLPDLCGSRGLCPGAQLTQQNSSPENERMSPWKSMGWKIYSLLKLVFRGCTFNKPLCKSSQLDLRWLPCVRQKVLSRRRVLVPPAKVEGATFVSTKVAELFFLLQNTRCFFGWSIIQDNQLPADEMALDLILKIITSQNFWILNLNNR